ncbi:MAG: ABC transporter substrate-binding protein [Desulfobacterales bacterium]
MFSLKIKFLSISFLQIRTQRLCCICLLMLLPHTHEANASEKIVLQLAWKHQFQFAGYYAALHKEYYRQAGLDVIIAEGGEGKFAREEVLSGRAQYGIAGAELLLHRAAGEPVVVLAAIFQHSASILLTRADAKTAHPQDLIGKRMMLLPGNKDADILAIFQNEGIPLHLIHRMDQSYNLDDLTEGRTDAVSAYITNEPWLLEQAGIKPGILFPQTYGVDFYSDCLFTTEQEIKKHPERVKKFLKASLEGWSYAMEHQEEIIDLLIRKYAAKKTRAHLRYEARTMENLIFPKLVEMGHMNPGRWRHIAHTFSRLGELPKNFPLEGFLYDPDPKLDVKKLKLVLFTLLFILVCTGLVLLFFAKMNRRLKTEAAQREKTEKSLRESEAQKEAILNGITANIAYVDRDLKILWANRTAAISAGRTPEALLGHKCHEFWADPAKPCDNCPTLKAFATKKSEHAIMRTPDGRIWDEKGEPVFDAQGRLLGVVEIAQDITDRILAEEKLRENESRMKTIFDTSPAGIILVDSRGIIIFANQGMADMFRIPMENLIGSAYPEHVHPDQRSVGKQKMEKLISGEIDYIAGERHYIRWDRTDFWGFLSGRRHEDEQGNLISLVGIIADITERKKLEQELRHAHKMESIGTLTGGIAHDFNNILGIIIGNTELALEDVPEWNPARSNLQAVMTAGRRAAGIVRQLLNFSRKNEMNLKPAGIVSLIEDCLALLRPAIPAGVEIRTHLPEAEAVILADSVQIRQILINLCTNAFQAMAENGGILEIAAEKMTLGKQEAKKYPDLVPGDYVTIAIRDTGSGIDAKIRDRIFDPYFTTKEFGQGSGMGLTIVLGIVKNHHGTIAVDSQPGKGSMFTLFFPAVAEKIIQPSEISDKIPKGCESVLFVDDEELIADMAQEMLGRLGYRVTAVQNPLQAFEIFQTKPHDFDLIITDMTMPQMTGLSLFEKLRKIRPDIPVILCSGYSFLMDAEKAEEIGFGAFVVKPATMRVIAKSIRDVLDKKGSGSA